MDTPQTSESPDNKPTPAPDGRQEVRSAVRFPVSLPVVIFTDEGQKTAVTRNISANGVLFDLESSLAVGQGIRFSLHMPGAVFGSTRDVLVHCRGRVVRCSISQGLYQAAVTIDEYQFAEQ